MNHSTQDIVNGIIKYADDEIMEKLPTTSRWAMGTIIALASAKIEDIISEMSENELIKMLGIIDDEGMVDVDALIKAMIKSSEKYGKMTLDIPLVGRLTFASNDIERLKNYI